MDSNSNLRRRQYALLAAAVAGCLVLLGFAWFIASATGGDGSPSTEPSTTTSSPVPAGPTTDNTVSTATPDNPATSKIEEDPHEGELPPNQTPPGTAGPAKKTAEEFFDAYCAPGTTAGRTKRLLEYASYAEARRSALTSNVNLPKVTRQPGSTRVVDGSTTQAVVEIRMSDGSTVQFLMILGSGKYGWQVTGMLPVEGDTVPSPSAPQSGADGPTSGGDA